MSDIKPKSITNWPMFWPTAKGRDGIHIAAQCQIDAQQLQSHGLGWAADTLLKAQAHISALEDAWAAAEDAKTPKCATCGLPFEGGQTSGSHTGCQ